VTKSDDRVEREGCMVMVSRRYCGLDNWRSLISSGNNFIFDTFRNYEPVKRFDEVLFSRVLVGSLVRSSVLFVRSFVHDFSKRVSPFSK